MRTLDTRPKKGLFSELFKYFNIGISYFLPVIIAGGMLFSLTLITGTIADGNITPSGQFWQNIYTLGQSGFAMMVPVMCAYIAYAIGSKPALAPGFILGYVANNPIGKDHISTGFLGALFLSSAGITEGAIPFAGKDFKRTWISCAVGTAVAGALGMIHGISSVVAFGGIVAITGVFEGSFWYVIDMLIGAMVIVLMLALTKPKMEIESMEKQESA